MAFDKMRSMTVQEIKAKLNQRGKSTNKHKGRQSLLLLTFGKSKWLWKGGLKGGKPAQRVSPLYVFFGS
ncbi:MAG: hypothetical protein FWD86_00270, partial [Firmicutes bacterium]|nr:hypothetical protein [Bacillota bacterium]